MTLPAPNLDDRRFQQLVDDAKRYVQQRCPEWTDHNVSDPGVTLIETFALMVDQLVYRLNRVPDRNYLAFLDLLGVTLLPPAAARTHVTFWLSAIQPNPVVLPTGTEVATQRTATEDAVVFTTTTDLAIVPCSFAALATTTSGAAPVDRTADLMAGKDVPCFAAAPQPGDAVLFGLTAPVPDCAAVLRLDSHVDGVGVDPRQPPLVWEAWTPDGWQRCEVERDETGGLNRPGEVVLHVPHGHAASRQCGVDGGWLRCRVVEPANDQPFYSVSPTVRSADAYTIGGTAPVVHAETVVNEHLGESSGVPGQRFRLARGPVVAGDPAVVVESSDGDGWQRWDVVDTFAASGPDDRHVRVEPVDGDVVFGPLVREPDGGVRRHGAVPPKGATLRAARYRVGGGRHGNVARGAVSVLRSAVPYVARVTNREAARGGVDGESVAEAKVRAPISLRAQDRAVTARDYEELVRRAAPEVARTACLAVDPGSALRSGASGDRAVAKRAGDGGGSAGAVRVLLVPQAVPDVGGRLRFEQLVPGDDLLARVTAYLDERRPVGARLAVGPPFYQGLTAVVTLHCFRGADAEQVRTRALDSLYGYLDPLNGGPHGTGWPFGRAVHAGDLFAVLQRVPGVELVDEVVLYPADPLTGRRGDGAVRIDLDRSALVFSYDHRVRVVEA